MRFKQLGLCILMMLGLLVLRPASAITLSFDPTSATLNPSDTLAVDIVVSDLGGEVVSAFDLDVSYDPSVLSATGVQFTNNLGDPNLFQALVVSDLSTPGIVDFAENSLITPFLPAIQGDSVVIATLSFLAIGIGVSELLFVPDTVPQVSGQDLKGLSNNILALEAVGDASISVVPLPGALWLMLTGLMGIGFASRRRVTAAVK